MAEPNSARSSTGGRTTPTSTTATSPGATSQSHEQHENWLLGRVRESATAGIESQKRRATDGLGSIAQVVRSSTEQLRSQHHESMAEYVDQAANQIDRFSQQLKNKDVRELVEDAQRLARRNPAAFAGTAFALGLVTARFLKSSNESGEYDEGSRERERWTGSGTGTSYASGERYGAPVPERGAASAPTHYTPPHGDAALATTGIPAEGTGRTTAGTMGTAGSASTSAPGRTGTGTTRETPSRPTTGGRTGGETERS